MKFAAVVLLPLTLGGCGPKSGVHEKNATVAEVSHSLREQAGRRGFIQPGEWLSTVTVDDVSMPGVSAAAAESMKRQLAGSRGGKSCLTPEQVSQPAPGFFAPNAQCRYDHFTMARGKIDAKMTCGAHGITETTTMSGHYSPVAYTLAMETSTESGAAGGGITMHMHVDARRLGPCSGKDS